jgi:hypothetical protein
MQLANKVKMKQYYSDSEIENLSKGSNSAFLKAENEFFDEEKQKNKADVFQIKFVSSKKHGDAWNICLNNRVLVEIKAYRLNKKEKKFIESPNGASYILKCAKDGLRSVTDLKQKIADKIKGD